MAPDNDNFEECMAYLENISRQKADLDNATSIADIMKPFRPDSKHPCASNLQDMVKYLGVGVVVFVYFDQNNEEDKPFFSGEHEDDYYLPYQKWAFKEPYYKEHSEYIHSLYEITRDFQKKKTEYRVWVDSEGKKDDEREYVDYGECIAYQLLWRYLVHHSCDSTYTSIEKGIKELHKEKQLDKFALKINSSSFKEDVDSIFFDGDEGICKKAFLKFCNLRNVDLNEDKISTVKNLKEKLNITNLYDLHENAPLPIAPYYYWNTISEQHLTHMHYPVWLHIPLKIGNENKPRIGCVCLTAVKPFQDDPTLQDITFNNDADLRQDRKIERFTRCLSLPYIDHFIYKNIRQSSLRNAVSAIMGRNMSHNIGSHVIARYAAVAGSLEEQREENLKRGVEDHRTVFLRYLQRRMDFIAEVSTSDKPNWSQPLGLVELLTALDFEKAKGCINEDGESKFEPILLSYITGKEGIKASVHIDPDARAYFNCPSGEVGAHALYVILENIIRNSARHNTDFGEVVKLTVEATDSEKPSENPPWGTLSRDRDHLPSFPRKRESSGRGLKARDGMRDFQTASEYPELLKLEITDCQTEKEEEGGESLDERINNIISNESFLKPDGSPNPQYWGIREMQICAQYLRGLPLSDLETPLSIGPPVLTAMKKQENGESRLAYRLYLQRPKLCAIMADADKICNQLQTEEAIKKLKGFGIALFNDLPEDLTELRGYSFVVLPKDRKNELSDNKLQKIQLPIRTFYVEDSFIQCLLEKVSGWVIEKVAEGADGATNFDGDQITSSGSKFTKTVKPRNRIVIHNETTYVSAITSDTELAIDPAVTPSLSSQEFSIYNDFDPALLCDPLHRRFWNSRYKNKRCCWKDKEIKALVAWQEGDDVCKQRFFHTKVSDENDRYKKWGENLKKEDSSGLVWVDHANSERFNSNKTPNLISAAKNFAKSRDKRPQPIIFSESFESISRHKPVLEEQMRGQISGDELIAAALARVIILDERVQSLVDKKHRGIPYNILWPCMGIWTPTTCQSNLNNPDLGSIQDFLDNPTEKSEQLPSDFLVLHLTILENLSRQSENTKQKMTEQEILNEFEDCKGVGEDCEVVIVSGRGVPFANINSDIEKTETEKALNERFLPISALLEHISQPSKLALMRSLWSA